MRPARVPDEQSTRGQHPVLGQGRQWFDRRPTRGPVPPLKRCQLQCLRARLTLAALGLRQGAIAEVDHPRYWRMASRAPVLSERSEEHTSELQSLMRISYADFCL